MKYILNLIGIAFLLSITVTGYSQQNVASAGLFFQNDQISVSWGIGELAIETLSSDDYILTQGFQQSKLEVTVIDDLSENGITANAYPNPTHDYVNVSLMVENLTDFEYHIINAEGKLIYRQQMLNNEEQVSFVNQEAGLYFIRIFNSTKLIKTFKIVKK